MECQQCHLGFKTPPVKEPRRFKCRKCGDVFVVRPPKKAVGSQRGADDVILTLETDAGEATIPEGKPSTIGAPGSAAQQIRQAAEDARKGDATATPPKKAPSLSDLSSICIPGYELISAIGQGGMGVVFKAKQVSLDRPVAIKILSPELAKIPKFVKRFNKEAKALSQLSHPGIVGVIDRGQADGVCYLVMEFVPGTTLRFLLQKVQMTLREFLDMVTQLLEALDYVHSKNIVHRDIKPENIIISKNRRMKLADFGLACLQDPDQTHSDNLTQQNSMMGTLNYMAPEQRLNAAKVDARADIYSLGVILYEIVTGELPLGAFDPPSKVNKRLNPKLDGIIIRALKPKATDRYGTAREMLDEIKAYLQQVAQKKAKSKQAREEAEAPLTSISSAKGKGNNHHSRVPAGAASKGYDVDEEQRMWQVWQDQMHDAKETSTARSQPTIRNRHAPASPLKQGLRSNKASAPSFYEAAINRDVELDARQVSRRNSWQRHIPNLVLFGIACVFGAWMLPRFPFLGRIPILGDLLMAIFRLLFSPY